MSILNIAINKYSIFVRKKMSSIKTLCVYYSQRVTSKPKITLTCLINRVIMNLITLIPRIFFVDEGEHMILALLCKANIEHQETCSSDWLKRPMSLLLTHIHFVFSCFTFQIWLCTT